MHLTREESYDAKNGQKKRKIFFFIKAVVLSVALYGSETWTMRKNEIDRLQAFEMWIWRRMEKISWRDRVTNDQVLEMVEENRMIIDVIRSRKKKWIGHVLRGKGLLKCRPWNSTQLNSTQLTATESN